MNKAIIIGICILTILLFGCTSSYEGCRNDCIELCMEGKEYKPATLNEPLTRWNLATSECKHECYDECKFI